MSTTELEQVLIDTKEPKNVIQLASEYFDDLKLKGLPVGDLVYSQNSVCIERKEVGDFVSSVIGQKGKPGRIWLQVANMVKNYQHPYIIIVGRFDEKYFTRKFKFTKKKFLGVWASIGGHDKVPVYPVNNNDDYFTLSRALMLKSDGERKSLNTVKRLPVTEDNVIEAIVSCIPGIGEKYAKRIIEEFSIVKAGELCNLSVDDLMKVDGVGRKKAVSIKAWF